jgi:hypothetical protein
MAFDARTAAGSIRVKIQGVKDLTARFERMPEVVREALIKEVTDLTFTLYAKVLGRASGDILKVISGRYLRSLRPRIRISTARVRGTVSSVGLGRRSGFLEFGGHAAARDIPVKSKKALHFLREGADIFAKVVHHPGPTIEPHPVIYGAFDEMRAEILDGLESAVNVNAD